MDKTKGKTVKEIAKGLKEACMDVSKEDFPKPKLGGLLVKECPVCGGTVAMVGTGMIREACSSCGRDYVEPVYRVFDCL